MEFRRANLVFALGPMCLPLALTFTDIHPPWPQNGTFILAGFEFSALILAFLYFRNSSLKSVRKAMVFSTATFFLLCLAYLILSSLLIFEAPTTQERFVSGFVCKPDGELLARRYREACPFLGLDAISAATYESDRIWTKLSISISRAALFMTWIILFCCFVFSISIFIAYRSSSRFSRT